MYVPINSGNMQNKAIQTEMRRQAHLAAAVNACVLPESNQPLHQAFLSVIQQVIIEHAGGARVSHQVDQPLLMSFLRKTPMSLRGALQP